VLLLLLLLLVIDDAINADGADDVLALWWCAVQTATCLRWCATPS
jgi:hypothetical protein